jgi:pSer/pThr/pTyr-binding forkhead associated (FHA) protein
VADLSLEIVEGPGTGKRFPLTGPVEIGRDDAADVQLDDDRISRRHARITPLDGSAQVEDLDSLNGTEVNGNELPSHAPTRMEPGDELRVGVVVLELRGERDIATRPSAARAVPPPLAVEQRRFDYLAEASEARRDEPEHELDEYLDAQTKQKARTAPLAIFAVVVIALLLYFALAK